MLNRNLRKQNTTLGAARNEQAMLTDFDQPGVDWARRRKQRNLNLQFVELFGPYGREPGILQRGARGAAYEGLAQRLVSFDYPDASLQTMLPA